LLPVEEEGRLNDPMLLENFERIFATIAGGMRPAAEVSPILLTFTPP
jgi:hypothetical protein